MSETVIGVLERTAEEQGERPALRFKTGGTWRTTSWREYRDAVLRTARGLMALGLEPGQGAVILGFNRPEWFIADLAAIAAGGVPSGIYTTCTPEQCRYIAHHCEAAVAVVESPQRLGPMLEARGGLPALRAIVLMEGESDELGVLTWAELLAAAERVPEAALRGRIDALRPEALCNLIYTSGTTGPPKAVMLSHHNIVWVARTVLDFLSIEPEDQFLSYLPLSHIAEQMLSLYAPLVAGCTVWFAESLEKLADNLREVRPHAFFGVPRVWEKIQSGIEAAGAASSPLKKRIARWARGVGLAGGYADQRGGRRPLLYPLADRLVFRKVRQRLGLDRARMCVTSAAPISLHTLEFFLSLGIPILEVYGMSECTGPTTISEPDRYRTGAAGFAIPGTELRIAEDGEICMRGPHVFLGYYKDEGATRETVDDDGWLHSGDIGTIDEEGFLRVTDRKKELIITSGGKNVAPQPIEAQLKSIPGVGLAAVVGDRRKYLSALLTLDPDGVGRAAEAAGSPARNPAAAAVCEIFRSYLETRIAEVNRTLASFETIKRFAVLPEPFTTEGGELTPTMKLKRRVILDKYAQQIDELYAGT